MWWWQSWNSNPSKKLQFCQGPPKFGFNGVCSFKKSFFFNYPLDTLLQMKSSVGGHLGFQIHIKKNPILQVFKRPFTYILGSIMLDLLRPSYYSYGGRGAINVLYFLLLVKMNFILLELLIICNCCLKVNCLPSFLFYFFNDLLEIKKISRYYRGFSGKVKRRQEYP